MKISNLLLFIASLFAACTQSDQRKIEVGWSPGYAYVPVCKEMVKYQGTGFEIQGVKVPVPALGGAAEIAGVKVDPKVLNQAYQTTQTLDFYFRSTCPLLASYTSNQQKFEQAVDDMRDAQVKLTQLALSLQSAPPTSAPVEKVAPVKSEAGPPKVASTQPTAAPPPPTTASSSASAAPAKKEVKKKLKKWVDAYAKKTKKKTVASEPKPNKALGLPATAPTPAPLIK